MPAPKDEKPNPQSEHLENLARMLREIEEELSEDEGEQPRDTPPDQSERLPNVGLGGKL